MSALPIARLAVIDAVLRDALAIDDDRERAAFLDQRCAADRELRVEVERLLAFSARELSDVYAPVAGFVADIAADPGAWRWAEGEHPGTPDSLLPPTRAQIERPTWLGAAELAGSSSDIPGLAVGELIGPYRITGLLGRGGMAVVYLAERAGAGFEQQVAVKVLPPTRSTAAIRRFEQERQILARLDHPHIARLFDGGVDRRGLPYLVMEHVDGQPLDRYCDSQRATIQERLRLIIAIAEAVQAAHQSLIVHRDLKPSNLLVTARGDVKLLDFGIAKLLSPESGDPGLTVTDSRPMTPTYASPEQVTGEVITTAADVYQIGLLLYELLTGHRPQGGSTPSLANLVRLVCETEPTPPSQVVREDRDGAPRSTSVPPAVSDTPQRDSAERLAWLRQSSPLRLSRALAGDLDAIVARALAKDPRRRYASPAHLAADLERHLTGQPVLARQGGGWYRAGKFLRRHTAAAAVSALALALTVGYAVASTLQANALLRERARTTVESQKAAAVERFLIDLFQVSDPSVSRGEQVTARELLTRGVERVDRDLAALPEVQARVLSTLGHIHGQLGFYAESQALEERALALRRAAIAHGNADGLDPQQRQRATAELAESLQRLASVLRRAGDHQAGLAPLTEAVALRRQVMPGSAELADALTELGHLQLQRGDDRAAEALYRETLPLRRALADRAGLAKAQESLGNLLTARGEHRAAESFHREALTTNLELHGERHPSVSSNLFNIGLALQGQERWNEAGEMFERTLSIDRALYGERHPEVGIDLLLVGNNAEIRRDLPAAEQAFTTALAIFEETLPEGHPRRIEALRGVGQLRMAQGRLSEAAELLDQALKAQQKRFGPDHVQVAHMMLPVGQCQVAAGRLNDAHATWTAALAIAEGRDASLSKRFEAELGRLAVRMAAAGSSAAPPGR